jgi:hypothetical protein
MQNRAAYKVFLWLVAMTVLQVWLMPIVPVDWTKALVYGVIGCTVAAGFLIRRYAPSLD